MVLSLAIGAALAQTTPCDPSGPADVYRTCISSHVLSATGKERNHLVAELTRLGDLTEVQGARLPTPKSFAVLMKQLVITEAQRTDIRTTYSQLDCFALASAPEALLCEADEIARIALKDCRVDGADIACQSRWCAPCQQVGIDTLLVWKDDKWRAAAKTVRGSDHGCGFGCMDEF